MKVSEHARQRWLERINPGAREPEKEIARAFAEAVEIYEETGDARILVKDDILFVYQPKEDVLVTVIDISFGFSPEINRELCKMQVGRVLEVKEELAELEDCVRIEIEEINDCIRQVDDEIRKLKIELEAKESLLSKYRAEKAARTKELEAKRAEYVAEVDKLRYSVNYRLEMIKQKGEARNAKKGAKSA